MQKNILKKFMAIILTLSMITSMFSGLNLKTMASIGGTVCNFSNFSSTNSGGTGYTKVGTYFKVANNIYVASPSATNFYGPNTAIYPNDAKATQTDLYTSNPYTATIYAEGTTSCKTFTFQDLGMSCYNVPGYTYNFSSFNIEFYNASGSLIKSENLGVSSTISQTSISQLTSLYPTHGIWNISGVASVKITFYLMCNSEKTGASNLQFENMIITNISNTVTYTASSISNQTLSELIAGYASGSQENKSVTVTKTGTGDLANLSVALSGTNADSFTLTQPASTTLNATTTSTTFNVKVKDSLAAGTYTATVTVSATNMTALIFTVTQVVTSAGYSTVINAPLAMTVSELTEITDFDGSDYMYTYGYTQPVSGSDTAQLYYHNPNDMSYLANNSITPSYEIYDNSEPVVFLATKAGTYTFYIKVGGYSNTTGVLEKTVTKLITVNVTGGSTPFTYTITPIDNQTLTEKIVGYNVGTQENKSITIIKTGTGDLTNLSVALSGTNAASFIITQPISTTLNSSTGSTTFTVKAKDGLAKGTYSATVTISETNMTSVTFTVTQVITNTAPTFVGTKTSLTVDENSGAADIKSLLHVSDIDSNQTLTWSQKTAPVHGTLSFTTATKSSGGTDITSGGIITYTPTANYSGTDHFTVQVSDGTTTAERTITVTVNDKTAPTGEITIKSNSWTSFLNTITFGIFFKETVNVTITATDTNGSGVKSTEYIKSATEISDENIGTQSGWSTYSESFSVTAADAEKFIIYVKITDNAGNIKYISSNGMTFDTTGPSVSTNYTKNATSMEVTVTDSGAGVGTVNYTINGGIAQTATLNENGNFTILSLAEGKYDIVINAQDSLGNEKSLTVNIVSVYTVTFKLFDGDTGEELKTQSVDYGNAATAPVEPTRTGFTFKSWDKVYNNITSDTTINATWNIGGITVTPYTGAFDNTAHDAVTVTGSLTGDIITYSTDGIIFTANCPQYTNADSYAVYVKIARTGYTTWESGLKTATISRVTGSITIIGDPSKTFDGNVVTDPEINKNGSGNVTYTYYNDNIGEIGTLLANTPSTAGIYWVKASMTQDTNYTTAEASKKFTIECEDITGNVSIPETILTGENVSVNTTNAAPEGVTFEYQWKLDGSPISQATKSSYTVPAADYGKKLTVVLTATGNFTGSITSNEVIIGENIAPTGEISVKSNSWSEFLNTITFNLFFKETVNVTITAADKGGSGVKSIEYYKSSTAIEAENIEDITEWSNYSEEFSITPADAEKFIIYAKITDKAGNVSYINSNGLEFDLSGPSISTDYEKDAESMEVTVTDSGSGVNTVTYTIEGGTLQTAALDSNGKFTISSLAEGKYDIVITAQDTLGNEKSLTVNVISIYTVTFKLFEDDTSDALKTESVEYGNNATAPSDPTRTGFVFKDWDKNYSNIKADTIVYATWDISDITIIPYTGIFDGIAHNAVTITGTLSGDIITYSTDGIDFTSECPQYTDAESYKIYINVARTGYTTWESELFTAIINKKEITEDMIANISSAEYTGQQITPLPEITYGTIVLIMDIDYTISYSNNTEIGLATIDINGIGNYSGTMSKSFAIYTKNTGIEIKDDETPQVLVDGLDDLYDDDTIYTEEDKQIEENGGTIKIELSVQVKTDTTEDKTRIDEIARNKIIGLYIDLSLYKTITLAGEENGTTTAISHLNELLTITIPIPKNIKGKKEIVLYRVHQGTAAIIPIGESNAVDGEYCIINDDSITLYVKNFSTYAIGYESDTSSETPNTGDNFTLLLLNVILCFGVITVIISMRKRKNI